MKKLAFNYTSLAHKVYFGLERKKILSDVLRPFQKVFVIASKRSLPYVQEMGEILGKEKLLYFDEVVQHVPQKLVDKAYRAFIEAQADALLAIGGGSAIGLAKAIAKESRHPIVALPSTYAGSEMTNIWGIRAEGGKTTGRDNAVMPRFIIYDPELTATMPVPVAATSAMNAMAHLVEAVYAPDSNPITYNNSLLGINKLLEGMKILADQKKLMPTANELILLGAYLAGKSLGEVSMALHHKAAHVLGGSFGLEHALVHSIMQAHVLEYQWTSLSEEIKEDFKKALDHRYPPKALQAIAQSLEIPLSLKEIGFRPENLPKAASLMSQNPYPNPSPLVESDILKMLENAFRGELKGE